MTPPPRLHSWPHPLRLAAAALLFALVLAPLSAPVRGAAADHFALKPGDRVCFYGDSITEQRYYGMDVETYVRTRFPDLPVEFVNSGVGGDKVGGGWAGGIDLRLERDVFPFKPNVVTIMLGMNDAKYRPFDEATFDLYRRGYEHLLDSLQQHLPGVRLVLLQPTPFDDITRAPNFPGGYNAVLVRYAAYVRQLAADRHLECVDFLTPLVDLLQKAQAEDPKLAAAIIPDRIHPSAVGELVMAQALLTAWGAPATVTGVTIDAAAGRVTLADNTEVDGFTADGGKLAWTQADACLPFPVLGLHESWWHFPPTERDWGALTFFTPAPEPKGETTDASAAQIVRLSGFTAALNQEPLKVTGLKPGRYALKIDGLAVGEFTAEQLGAGVNLAEYPTPMLDRARGVLELVWKQTAWRFFAWRGIQTQLTFDEDPAVQAAAQALIAALEAQRQTIAAQEYAAARPQPNHYELAPVGP